MKNQSYPNSTPSSSSLEFILFLNPEDRSFYSYCALKGILVKETNIPHLIINQAYKQLQELSLCLSTNILKHKTLNNNNNHNQNSNSTFNNSSLKRFKKITTFQRRAIPLNLIIQRKFKYPVYFTEEYLPASTLQTLKLTQTGQIAKDNLFDYVSAKIYLGELAFQLEKSKKNQTPSYVTIDIKLIASVNQVIRTINRVILQDYGIVITMKNSTNKLIFKIKDKKEFLYGNQAISNFQYIRESINDRRQIQLQILEVSIYDKDQFLEFVFHRDLEQVNRGEFSPFPWNTFLSVRGNGLNKENNSSAKQKDSLSNNTNINPNNLQFLVWYLPDEHHLHPQSKINLSKIFSTNELIRTNQKIKLKLEEKKRLQMKKVIRFLWKDKIFDFLEKRRNELKNHLVEVDTSIIYSGQCFFCFEVGIVGVKDLYMLFQSRGSTINVNNNKDNHGAKEKERTDGNRDKQFRLAKKKVIKLAMKENAVNENNMNNNNINEGMYENNRLPSNIERITQILSLKRKHQLDITPNTCTITTQFLLGNKPLTPAHSSSFQSKSILIENNLSMTTSESTISFMTLARMPLQTTMMFRINIYSKQGQGYTFGVGVLKIFDQFGFLRQGEQHVDVYPVERVQGLRIGCMQHDFRDYHNIENMEDSACCKLILKMPTYSTGVIWTLSDSICSKILGYQPTQNPPQSQSNTTSLNPLSQSKQTTNKDSTNLERLNELLRYDPLKILNQYTDKDKELLRKCKKFYKHQSQKFINYLYSVNFTDPSQISELYTTMSEWAPLKPIQALFLLNPEISDEKVRYFAVKRMQNFHDYQFVLYANQITQALVSFETDNNPLIDLILQKCVYQPYTIGQEYFWQFKNRTNQLYTSRRFILYLESLLLLSNFRKEFVKQININNYLIEMNENLIKETESLPAFKDKNKKFLTMLSDIQHYFNKLLPEGFLFPIRPQCTFKTFNRDQCKMFDSKKLPFALACVPYQNYKGQPYRIMFKYGDDIKQDHLVLQIFKIFDKLWRENGLDFKMNVYRTLSTGDQIGFIELVDGENNSKIHKDFGKGLVQAFDQRATLNFLENYNQDKRELAIAKENYLRSSVGYLVSTYVLGIGDRHSGNVMVQKNGKFFHIDFGHILGNFKTKFNIKRQRTPVLFTSQFSYVMGGQQSKEFSKFLQLCSKAYNILRKNAFLIINLLIMMVSAQIPQLKRLQDVGYLVQKLSLELSEAQAAEKLNGIIRETLMSQKSRNLDNAFHEANRQG